ncbi:phosphoribosyltransferase [Variovorax sp. J22R133]|uniref:phosphoribosyltransferase n=1 Tax=Variovorax brevis TaxID=3053503 RepID=UPI0025762BDB|nr:phosphoribosyltransferase [Variovorax sp. J22R133]MDM0114460.1 phosphoribosyltransferase [Variovorax sp. J22R133]
MKFDDRRHAGKCLAQALAAWRGQPNLLVLALPRGGVPVAAEVAHELQAPLDVLIVRKLGYPGQEEFAMGAIASGGIRVMSDVAGMWPVSEEAVEEAVRREQAELTRREQLYRGDRKRPTIKDRVVLLVDDGLATGATMRAAVQSVRLSEPARVVVAVPVGSQDAVASLSLQADEVVCVETPEPFHAVGLWYRDFDQTSDDEVRDLLKRSQIT